MQLPDELRRMIFGARKTGETTPVAPASETVLRGRPGVIRPPELPVKAPVAVNNKVPIPTIVANTPVAG